MRNRSLMLPMIKTHLELYRYTRLPFDIAAAPANFQRIIDKLLNGLSQTGGILDDLIVTREDEPQPVSNLHRTLKKLERCGVKLKKSKWAIMQPQIEYFVFIVDRNGIHRSPAKVKAILRVQELQSPKWNWATLFSGFGQLLPEVHSKHDFPGESAQQAAGQGHTWRWSHECAN